MTDEEGIRRTIAEYCQLMDDGHFEQWADLYAEDATFTAMGQTQRGRAALKSWIENAQPPERRGKHVAISSVIDVDGDTATARTDYVFVGRTADGLAITSAGRYHDRFVRDPDRWRFAERRIVFMGDKP